MYGKQDTRKLNLNAKCYLHLLLHKKTEKQSSNTFWPNSTYNNNNIDEIIGSLERSLNEILSTFRRRFIMSTPLIIWQVCSHRHASIRWVSLRCLLISTKQTLAMFWQLMKLIRHKLPDGIKHELPFLLLTQFNYWFQPIRKHRADYLSH